MIQDHIVRNQKNVFKIFITPLPSYNPTAPATDTPPNPRINPSRLGQPREQARKNSEGYRNKDVPAANNNIQQQFAKKKKRTHARI
ncbi:hypothetical protein Vi05172_g9975 [Venturia inaequalis]|nr:hypothetical protein Vi05172_g9975 [Venturia inaequalis]